MLFIELVRRDNPPHQEQQKLQHRHDSGDWETDDDEICTFSPKRRKLLECYGN